MSGKVDRFVFRGHLHIVGRRLARRQPGRLAGIPQADASARQIIVERHRVRMRVGVRGEHAASRGIQGTTEKKNVFGVQI